MTGFRSENEALAARAGAFAELSERAGRIAADLAGSLGSSGDCWGSDEPGRAFAGCHVEPAAAALRAVEALPGGLLDVGTRFTATAGEYTRADDVGESAVRDAGHGAV